MAEKKVNPKAVFLSDIRDELKKVSWPMPKEAIRLTATVFVISLIVGLYVGIIDVLLAKLLEILSTIR